jgi:hypothetical protein
MKKRTSETRKFGGKIYHRRGPIYCPAGTRWAWLKEEVKELRRIGHLVRVEKEKIEYPPDAPKYVRGNTHIVYLYVREK